MRFGSLLTVLTITYRNRLGACDRRVYWHIQHRSLMLRLCGNSIKFTVKPEVSTRGALAAVSRCTARDELIQGITSGRVLQITHVQHDCTSRAGARSSSALVDTVCIVRGSRKSYRARRDDASTSLRGRFERPTAHEPGSVVYLLLLATHRAIRAKTSLIRLLSYRPYVSSGRPLTNRDRSRISRRSRRTAG